MFVSTDGSVRVGRGNNTRYGYKIPARCNNPSCDAVVDIYVEAEAVNNGEVESTGAAELIERLEDKDLIPETVTRGCSDCGQTFVTEVDVRLADDGGIDLRAKCSCPNHSYSNFIYDVVEHIEPEEIDEELETLEEKV